MADLKIMAIDDEESILDSIRDYFNGLDINTFNNPIKAAKELENNYYDIIIADYKMPALNGLELLIEAKKKHSYNFGILLTAYAEKDLLEHFINKDLIKKVIEKPLKLSILKETIEYAFKECKKSKEKEEELLKLNILYKDAQDQLNINLENIVGINSGLRNIFKRVQNVATTSENILITGETGTGKEVIAKAVHLLSLRKDKPFVKINCGAIPENLMESELFGHVKGAYTGAGNDKIGKIELSNNGTLFLDEIGELKPELQTKLLNVIQEKKIERIGSNKIIDVNFRLISATNQNLEEMIKERRFREDLYYRINTIHLDIPSLRARINDLEPLVENLIKRYCKEIGINEITIEKNAVEKLKEYSWPGNIRELENVIKRVILLNIDKSQIEENEFDYLFYRDTKLNNKNVFEDALEVIIDKIIESKKDFNTIEKDILSELLKKYNGNVMNVVKATGIPKDRFYRIKKKFK